MLLLLYVIYYTMVRLYSNMAYVVVAIGDILHDG